MFEALLNIFFPKVCFACQDILTDNEQDICTVCRHALPVTQFHFNNDPCVKKIFFGRVKIEQATALLRFEKKGITQKLLHQLKYKKQEDVGKCLGEWLGGELQQLPLYNNIDLVIPVPIHPSKLKKRGYNQSAKFAQQLALALNAEFIDDVLIKTTNSGSQVFKNRLTRWSRNDGNFNIVNADKIKGKHILLADDIITTGATLESCALLLSTSENVKISIATMAIA